MPIVKLVIVGLVKSTVTLCVAMDDKFPAESLSCAVTEWLPSERVNATDFGDEVKAVLWTKVPLSFTKMVLFNSPWMDNE